MRYSVCIIDNDIPAAGTIAQAAGIKDSQLLNASNLEFLLQHETWTDDVIKNLARTLIDQTEPGGISPKWEVNAFTNPAFYINAIDSGLFRSDLVVFDWEYPGAQAGSGTDSETLLKEILDRTFCLVFIFSKADKEAEINTILAQPRFLEYKGRVEYMDKKVAEIDQTGILLSKADAMHANNFSFKFASSLRKKAVQSVDKILSDMGKASLNDIKNQIVVGNSGKKDFIDFIAERFRTALAGKDIEDLVDEMPDLAVEAATPDRDLISKVWSYRLYFQPKAGDDLVKCGDILKLDGSFYLILSADCDLVGFLKKNLGIINAVALHELNQKNMDLKELLTLCVEANKIPGKIHSLLEQVGELSKGPFVLPFVPADGSMKNFLAVPKDLKSFRITVPVSLSALTGKQKGREAMKYAYWANAERVCSVSEPFLTPVIQHVLSTIGGNGVPDYSDPMKEVLEKILKEFSEVPVVVTETAVPTIVTVQ